MDHNKIARELVASRMVKIPEEVRFIAWTLASSIEYIKYISKPQDDQIYSMMIFAAKSLADWVNSIKEES